MFPRSGSKVGRAVNVHDTSGEVVRIVGGEKEYRPIKGLHVGLSHHVPLTLE